MSPKGVAWNKTSVILPRTEVVLGNLANLEKTAASHFILFYSSSWLSFKILIKVWETQEKSSSHLEAVNKITCCIQFSTSNMANLPVPRNGMTVWEQELCMSYTKCSYFPLLLWKSVLAHESMKGIDTEKGLHYSGFYSYHGIAVPYFCSRLVL